MLECTVKYSTTSWEGSWVKATEMPAGNLPNPVARYTDNQSVDAPYFRFDNKKLRIYPAPTINVTNWLVLRYARTNVDVALTTVESALSIPRDYIWVILEGMSYQLKKTNKSVDAKFYKEEWNEALLEMLTAIWDRYMQPWQYRNPVLTNLMRL